jgi:hypothetical protein
VTGESDIARDDDAGDGFPDETHPPSKQVAGCLLAIAVLPLLAPIVIYFGNRGDEERGWLFVGLLGTFALILYQHRKNYRKPYFAAVAPALFLAQFLGGLVIPLPDWHIRGRAIMPFVIVALVANVSVFRLFERLWNRKEPHGDATDTPI